jgi:uncharacterized membrane protein (UPF0127 family)
MSIVKAVVFRNRFIPLIMALAVLLTNVLRAEPAAAQPRLETARFALGSTTVTAELARTEEQKQTGLMFRKKMGDNEGMLFFFKEPRQMAFWMMNTLLPLSIAYLDASGNILEIHDMQPLDTRTTPSKSNVVSLALEMNQGWFELNHIKPGDRLVPSQKNWPELFKAPISP